MCLAVKWHLDVMSDSSSVTKQSCEMYTLGQSVESMSNSRQTFVKKVQIQRLNPFKILIALRSCQKIAKNDSCARVCIGIENIVRAVVRSDASVPTPRSASTLLGADWLARSVRGILLSLSLAMGCAAPLCE